MIINTNYNPFGMLMPERGSGTLDYRYAYNGMELDIEPKGNGNSYTTEFRQYDPRLGRWLSQDPIMHPHQSPFCALDNNPIQYIDADGQKIKYAVKGKEKRIIKSQIRKLKKSDVFKYLYKGLKKDKGFEIIISSRNSNGNWVGRNIWNYGYQVEGIRKPPLMTIDWDENGEPFPVFIESNEWEEEPCYEFSSRKNEIVIDKTILNEKTNLDIAVVVCEELIHSAQYQRMFPSSEEVNDPSNKKKFHINQLYNNEAEAKLLVGLIFETLGEADNINLEDDPYQKMANSEFNNYFSDLYDENSKLKTLTFENDAYQLVLSTFKVFGYGEIPGDLDWFLKTGEFISQNFIKEIPPDVYNEIINSVNPEISVPKFK